MVYQRGATGGIKWLCDIAPLNEFIVFLRLKKHASRKIDLEKPGNHALKACNKRHQDHCGTFN